MRPDALQADLAAAAKVPPGEESTSPVNIGFASLGAIGLAPGVFRKAKEKSAALFDGAASRGNAMSSPKVWTFAEWLEDIDMSKTIAHTLLEETRERTTADGATIEVDELSMVMDLVAEHPKLDEVVKERLMGGMNELVDFLVRKLIALAVTGASPQVQPNEKFTLNEALVSKPDGLADYYGGLESKIGPPSHDVFEAVEEEVIAIFRSECADSLPTLPHLNGKPACANT